MSPSLVPRLNIRPGLYLFRVFLLALRAIIHRPAGKSSDLLFRLPVYVVWVRAIDHNAGSGKRCR
jgi:hypothetical protein